MKSRTQPFIAIFLLATSALARPDQSSTSPPSSVLSVLKAITEFTNSPPLSTNAQKAADAIWRFAVSTSSTNYATLYFLPEFAPFVSFFPPTNSTTTTTNISRALSTAFIAGNLRAQLVTRTIADDPYEGILQMLQTYAQLTNADTNLHIPRLEDFIRRQEHGQLEQDVRKILAKRSYPREKMVPQFVFGYGSLINSSSRALTMDSAGSAVPVEVEGATREWGEPTGFRLTAVSIRLGTTNICNGVVVPLNCEQLGL